MSSEILERVLRGTARIGGAASLLFLSAFIFGPAERSGNWPTAIQWFGLAFFPVGIVVGLVIAWWKEVLGGGITLLSLIGFYAWRFAIFGQLAAGPWFAIVAAPGLLFLFAGLIARRKLSGTRPSTL